MSRHDADSPRLLSLPLFEGEEHPCSYLPGRIAREAYTFSQSIDSAAYQELMDRGFRRSASVFYTTHCDGCRACVPIRVPVDEFRPSASQRRALRKNRDVRVVTGEPQADLLRHALFSRYQDERHAGKMSQSFVEFVMFSRLSPIDTLEMSYWVGRRLVGVGLVDVTPLCLSSVYFYFDPDERRRSLGIFSSLCEIAECRRRGLPYWYIGYYVAGCRKMDYKAEFRPHELLGEDGVWRRQSL